MHLRVVLPVAFVATTLAWSPTPEEMTLREALQEISSHVDAHIFTIGEGARRLVDLTPQEDREGWLEELERIAHEYKADLWPLGNETYYFERQGAITMEFNQADMRVVLDLIARNAGTNVLCGEEVEGLVSVNLHDAPAGRALDAVVETAGYRLVRERGSVYRANSKEHEERLARHPLSPKTLAALGLGESVPTGSKTVTLDEEGVPASEVLEKISQATGLNVFIEDENDGPVTITVKDLPWKGAVEAVARQTHGVIWDDGKGKVAIRRIQRVTMEFHTSRVTLSLDLILKSVGRNLLVRGNVGGPSGLNFKDVPWRDAVYALSRSHSFHIDIQDNVFIVSEFRD